MVLPTWSKDGRMVGNPEAKKGDSVNMAQEEDEGNGGVLTGFTLNVREEGCKSSNGKCTTASDKENEFVYSCSLSLKV